MALSNLFCVPASANFSFLSSASLDGIVNGIQQKLVPTNFDQSKWDCTGITGLAIYADNGLNSGSPGYLEESIPVTLIANDATGVTFTVEGSDFNTKYLLLNASNGSNNGKITVQATDGTNTQLVGQGRWTVTPQS